MPELYIHIGLHKTGSTSIQATMFKNRKKLGSEHGIYYLPLNVNHGRLFYSLYAKAPHRIGKNILAGLDEKEKVQQYNESLIQKITVRFEENRSKRIVISGERISTLSPDGVERFRDFMARFCDAPRIIVYVRDPVGWSTSRLQQAVKGANTLENFRKNIPVPQFQKRIEPFIRCFGRENVDIRCFNDAIGAEGGLIGDFMSAIGKSPALLNQLHVVRSNESLCAEAVLLMNEIKNHKGSSKENKRSLEQLQFKASNLLKGMPGGKFTLPKEAAEAVEQRSKSEIEWLTSQLGKNPFENCRRSMRAEGRLWSKPALTFLSLKLLELSSELRILRAEETYLKRLRRCAGRPPVADYLKRRGEQARAHLVRWIGKWTGPARFLPSRLKTRLEILPNAGEEAPGPLRRIAQTLFEQFREIRLLKAEIAYLRGERAAARGKQRRARGFLERAVKADVRHDAARRLLADVEKSLAAERAAREQGSTSLTGARTGRS